MHLPYAHGTTLFLLLIVAPTVVAEKHNENSANPYEDLRTLTAYRLPSSMETSFSAFDGNLSPFWNEWQIQSIECPLLQPFHEKESSSSENPMEERNQFHGPFDAQMTVRAAYGENGLYLLFDVIDDEFPGPRSRFSWANDAVDFFLDRHSPEELYGDTAKYFFLKGSEAELTQSQIQFQHSFAEPESRDSVNIVIPRSDFKLEEYTGSAGVAFLSRRIAVDDSGNAEGIRVETVVNNEMRVAQEWFIPWSMIRKEKGPPERGESMSLSMAYNDMDSDNSLMVGKGGILPKKVSWDGFRSPYDRGRDTTWGRLRFGRPLVEILEISDVVRKKCDEVFERCNMRLLRLESRKPDELVATLSDTMQYLYGAFSIADTIVLFAVESATPPEKIGPDWRKAIKQQKTWSAILDRNGNRDLRDDPVRTIDISGGPRSIQPFLDSIQIDGTYHRFIMKPLPGNRVLAAPEDAYVGHIVIAGKTHKIGIAGTSLQGRRSLYDVSLSIDFNGDGKPNTHPGAAEYFKTAAHPIVTPSAKIWIRQVSSDYRTIICDSIVRGTYERKDACIGSHAPSFAAVDTKGRTISLDKLYADRGYTILTFYSESCPSCKDIWSAEKAPVDRAAATFKQELNTPVSILGIKMDGSPRRVSANFPTIHDNGGWLGPIFDLYHVRSVPTAVVIDPEGRIVYRGTGSCSRSIVAGVKRTLDSRSRANEKKQGLFRSRGE